jgi:hypothetical protein
MEICACGLVCCVNARCRCLEKTSCMFTTSLNLKSKPQTLLKHFSTLPFIFTDICNACISTNLLWILISGHSPTGLRFSGLATIDASRAHLSILPSLNKPLCSLFFTHIQTAAAFRMRGGQSPRQEVLKYTVVYIHKKN